MNRGIPSSTLYCALNEVKGIAVQDAAQNERLGNGKSVGQ